ncbi:MAG: transglycosylase domain-containing protein [Spirochaetaceae bacterium]|jgi:penicillin-binding protein 1C|nr:transglycosylase domain-containing protein [Spirochaetaceae bacterium]
MKQKLSAGPTGLCVSLIKKFRSLLILFVSILILYLGLRFSPYPHLAKFLQEPYSTVYIDRNAALLQVRPLQNGSRREYISLSDLPPLMKKIIITTEDSRFYNHSGYDTIAICRALLQNIAGKRTVSGASTITMQLARIIKRQTNISDDNRPSIVRKINEAFNAMRLESRFSKDQILEMYINAVPFSYNTIGYVGAARTFFGKELSQLSKGEMQILATIPRRPSYYGASLKRFSYPMEAPHLINYLQGNKETNTDLPPPQVTLTIDLSLQQYLENLIATNVNNYFDNRITNGAGIVIDNQSGEVLAYVGSADFYNNKAGGQIDGLRARQQMGSSMKPFLYALALENGLQANTLIADVPSTFGAEELYIPFNFNNRFNGPVLFRTALASSLNVPAVELLYRLGVKQYSSFLDKLGFSIEQNTGLGLALGNSPVSLLSLAHAFSIFPNEGKLVKLNFMLSNSSLADKQEAPQVIQADTARIICSILSDNTARSIGFRQGNIFKTSFPAIFKTGTANQYQSIVALGATVQYTVAVWMGNFSGETVVGKTGSSVPAKIVRNILEYLNGNTNIPFAEPEHYEKTLICALSGMKPGPACIAQRHEYLLKPQGLKTCKWHYLDGNGKISTQYPAEYQSWFESLPRQGSIEAGEGSLAILSPKNGFEYLYYNGADSIPAEAIGGKADTITVYYDDTLLYTTKKPFYFDIPYKKGAHSIRIENGDEEDSVVFVVR